MTARRRIITVTNPTCEVVVFMRQDGSAQAIVTSDRHTTTHEIPKAPKGERIAVKRMPDGCVEIMYEETK